MSQQCTCGEHPSLAGIPSDNRIDNPNCPQHHPETVIAKTINISISGELNCGAEDMYPDGVPGGLTAADVRKMMQTEGKLNVLEDWGFADDLDVWVQVDGGPMLQVWNGPFAVRESKAS